MLRVMLSTQMLWPAMERRLVARGFDMVVAPWLKRRC
jgi:hypothetical protein